MAAVEVYPQGSADTSEGVADVLVAVVVVVGAACIVAVVSDLGVVSVLWEAVVGPAAVASSGTLAVCYPVSAAAIQSFAAALGWTNVAQFQRLPATLTRAVGCDEVFDQLASAAVVVVDVVVAYKYQLRPHFDTQQPFPLRSYLHFACSDWLTCVVAGINH